MSKLSLSLLMWLAQGEVPLRFVGSSGFVFERGIRRERGAQRVACCTFAPCQCQQAVPVSPGGRPRPGLRRSTARLHKLTAYAPYGPESPSNFPPSAGPALTHHRKVTVSSAWLVKIQMTLWETTMIVAITNITWWDQILSMCVQNQAWKWHPANEVIAVSADSTDDVEAQPGQKKLRRGQNRTSGV